MLPRRDQPPATHGVAARHRDVARLHRHTTAISVRTGRCENYTQWRGLHRDGRVVWTAGGGYYASPIAVEIGGTRQIISATQDAIVAVSPAGNVLWRHPWQGGNGSTTPLLSGGLVIVSDGTRVAGIHPQRQAGGWTVEQAWVTTGAAMSLSNPVVVGDVLNGMSTKQRGRFFAIDATTGITLWLGERPSRPIRRSRRLENSSACSRTTAS